MIVRLGTQPTYAAPSALAHRLRLPPGPLGLAITFRANGADRNDTKSAEGAALNSHGRKAVVRRQLRGPEARRAGIEIGDQMKMSHLRRSESIFSCQPTALRPWLFNGAPSALLCLCRCAPSGQSTI